MSLLIFPPRGRAYAMPMVETRKRWEERRRANDLPKPKSDRVIFAHCARCEVCIGAEFVHTDAYCLPTLPAEGSARTLQWSLVCGTCAVADLGLAPGYALVLAADWERDPQLAFTRAGWDAKIRRLETELLPAWGPYLRSLARLPRTPRARSLAWEQFRRLQRPARATLSTVVAVHHLYSEERSA